ncbi:MAG TPA: alpha/beta fold hydrolase [Gemmatimonadaceae bacterium]|nr:alpha/beta fold hydrolase [Gemmatimonadaceae bacterium]
METTTSRDGTTIAYWPSGSGPPLLLVHGTTADHTRWARVTPALEERQTVFVMDRRGRGRSGDVTPYRIEREAEDVVAVIDAIGEPTALLGHSFGAICCLEAARLSNAVRRLMLYEPPIPVDARLVPPAIVRQIDELVQTGEPEAALLHFFREVVRVPEADLDVMRSLPVWRTRVSLAHTIPRELRVDDFYRFDPSGFSTMRTPTLLLLGGESPAFFRRAIEALNAALPHSRLAILPGQQHIAMDTAPVLFTEGVLRFLSEAP